MKKGHHRGKYPVKRGARFKAKWKRCEAGVKASNTRYRRHASPAAVCTVSLRGHPPRRRR